MFGSARHCLAGTRDDALRCQTPPLCVISKLRPSRSPVSVITLYATVENTRSPGAWWPIGDRRTRAMVAPWSLGDVGTPAHARTP